MKIFNVEVTQNIIVTLDETKFTPEFLAEFNGSISDWGDDLEKHAEHLAWVHATGREDLEYTTAATAPFVEGYGPICDLGIKAKVESTYIYIES
jgi:hypothetical protein